MTDREFVKHREIWNENAKKNAEWSIISDPSLLSSGWDQKAFLASGQKDIKEIMDDLEANDHLGPQREKSLDFGCGLGRLTQPLSAYFSQSVGVDVSEEMIRKAKSLHSSEVRCEFIYNPEANLDLFPDASFNFILSLMVFQHIPPPHNENYFCELIQKLTIGGVAVFHIVSERSRSKKNVIRKLVPELVFRWKHRWMKPEVPYVTMFGIHRSRVESLVKSQKAEVLKVEADRLGGDDWVSFTYRIRKL